MEPLAPTTIVHNGNYKAITQPQQLAPTTTVNHGTEATARTITEQAAYLTTHPTIASMSAIP